jgi:hypothetical protein
MKDEEGVCPDLSARIRDIIIRGRWGHHPLEIVVAILSFDHGSPNKGCGRSRRNPGMSSDCLHRAQTADTYRE